MDLQISNSVTFNINIPPLQKHEIKGWKWTIQGKTKYMDTFESALILKGIPTIGWLVREI